MILLFLLFLVSCSGPPLSVFTEYVSIESLPSFRIGTPDPRLYCPDAGEKLHISWDAPQSKGTLQVKLYLRFGSGKDQTLCYNLSSKKGTLIFPLLNQEYWENQGILTYKIELYCNDALISTWLHQLWADRIEPQEDSAVSK